MSKEKTIDYLLRSTWIAISKYYNEKASEYEGSMVTAFTLLSIDPKKGTQSTALGPKMGLEPTSLSRTLKKLEKEELIEKLKNPNDGRSVIIRLTPYGLKMRDQAKKSVLNFHGKIEDTIGQEELQNLMGTLNKIYQLTTDLTTKLQNEKTY